MKKTLTGNIGLKIISLIAAFILWMIVVNTDDPMITRTYSGISVEVINTDSITDQGKTFEIMDNTDTISVIVHAKRSVIEDMSRDYIRATADMKEVTAVNTIPIEVRSTRFSDRIDSLTPVTRNVKVQIEDLGVRRIRITAEATGTPDEGYVAGNAVPTVNILTVSGPASVVERVAQAKATVDVTGVKSDISTSAPVNLYDENGNLISESMLDVSVTEVHVDVKILETKTVPVSCGHITGVPAEGFQMSGAVSIDPDSVRISGSGKAFEELEAIKIPDDMVSVSGATGNVVQEIDVSGYLPEGTAFADPGFDGIVTVTIYIGSVAVKDINVPAVNISITNIPEGYSAVLVDVGGFKPVGVYGLSDNIRQLDGNTVTGVINATGAIPAELIEQGLPLQGSYSGEVAFNLPSGISVREPAYMEFVLNPISASTLPAIEAPQTDTQGEAVPEGANVIPDINNGIGGDIVPDLSVTSE
ncbi:MAG TPA: hypothetical protein DCL38_02215 [Lachnospiraceae bacterium]|nr:hypothetical protein [Lachnospiraceae bacterium]